MAWQLFMFAFHSFREADSQSSRVALDDALKDTLVQLRLGLETFAARAKQSGNSRRALHWSDGFDLVSQSVVQAAALLDKYTKDLNSGEHDFVCMEICTEERIASIVTDKKSFP